MIPQEYEQRVILIEYISNKVIDETMPSRASHGLAYTKDFDVVRSIVDKVFRELEKEAQTGGECV